MENSFIQTVLVDELQFFFLVRRDTRGVSPLIRVDTFVTSYHENLGLEVARFFNYNLLRDKEENEPNPWYVSYKQYNDWYRGISSLRKEIEDIESLQDNYLPIETLLEQVKLKGFGVRAKRIKEVLEDYPTKNLIASYTSFTNLEDLVRLFKLSERLDVLKEGDAEEVYYEINHGKTVNMDVQDLISSITQNLFEYPKNLGEGILKAYYRYILFFPLYENLASPAESVSISNTLEGLKTLGGILKGNISAKSLYLEELPLLLDDRVAFPMPWNKK